MSDWRIVCPRETEPGEQFIYEMPSLERAREKVAWLDALDEGYCGPHRIERLVDGEWWILEGPGFGNRSDVRDRTSSADVSSAVGGRAREQHTSRVGGVRASSAEHPEDSTGWETCPPEAADCADVSPPQVEHSWWCPKHPRFKETPE